MTAHPNGPFQPPQSASDPSANSFVHVAPVRQQQQPPQQQQYYPQQPQQPLQQPLAMTSAPYPNPSPQAVYYTPQYAQPPVGMVYAQPVYAARAQAVGQAAFADVPLSRAPAVEAVPAAAAGGAPAPTRAEFLARTEWRRVMFHTQSYLQAAWILSKRHWGSLMGAALTFLLAVVLPLLPLLVQLVRVLEMRHDDEHVSHHDWHKLTACAIISVLLFILSAWAVLLPMVVGFPTAVFDAMRTGAPLRFRSFFVRGRNMAVLKVLLLDALISGITGIISSGFSTCWSVFSVFSVPILVDQNDAFVTADSPSALSTADVIRASVNTTQRYFFSLVHLLIACFLIVALSCLTVVGPLLTLPMSYIAIMFAYAHLVGVRGVALSPELKRPDVTPVVIDEDDDGVGGAATVPLAFRAMPCFAVNDGAAGAAAPAAMPVQGVSYAQIGEVSTASRV